MSEYSQELKLKVIHHYLAGNEGFIQTALGYGFKRDVLHKWSYHPLALTPSHKPVSSEQENRAAPIRGAQWIAEQILLN